MTEPIKLTEAHLRIRIANYWRERGYNVEVQEAECLDGKKGKYHAVRSVLVGGLPPKYYTNIKGSLAVPPRKGSSG